MAETKSSKILLTYVINSKGKREKFDIGKIQNKIQELIELEPKLSLNAVEITCDIMPDLIDGMSTDAINCTIADILALPVNEKYDEYLQLAGRLLVDSTRKNAESDLYKLYTELYENTIDGTHVPIVSKKFYEFIKEHHVFLQSHINFSDEYEMSYSALKIERSKYLLQKCNGKLAESLQARYMRCAIGPWLNTDEEDEKGRTITKDILDNIIYDYNMYRKRETTLATPGIGSAGCPIQQMVSCNVVDIEDSLSDIADKIGIISKLSGHGAGVGASISVRANGAPIRKGTRGAATGPCSVISLLNEVFHTFSQGGKREGSGSCWVQMDSISILEKIRMVSQHGAGQKSTIAHDMNFGIMVPDLFMERLLEDGKWSLFDIPETPLLKITWGQQYKDAYLDYERKGLAKKVVECKWLLAEIIEKMKLRGEPYICSKCAFNRKSNQQNIGPIICSNLCTEIALCNYQKIASCNLMSISLKKFVYVKDGQYMVDHRRLGEVTRRVTTILNRIVDINYYVDKKIKDYNIASRPLGIGTQGLANIGFMCDLPYISDEMERIDVGMHETIYYNSMLQSALLAKEEGPYDYYKGSPVSYGLLQPDMWLVEEKIKSGILPDLPIEELMKNESYAEILMNCKYTSNTHDWAYLRELIKKYGIRNSEVTTLMPTASTSIILDNYETIEPQTNNYFLKKMGKCQYNVVNLYLVDHLKKLNIDTSDIFQYLVISNGSLKNSNLPHLTKQIYMTVYEISKLKLNERMAKRSRFISQSASNNLYFINANNSKIGTVLKNAWEIGLKTWAYYTRSKTDEIAMLKIGYNRELAEKIIEKWEGANNSNSSNNTNNTNNINNTNNSDTYSKRQKIMSEILVKETTCEGCEG